MPLPGNQGTKEHAGAAVVKRRVKSPSSFRCQKLSQRKEFLEDEPTELNGESGATFEIRNDDHFNSEGKNTQPVLPQRESIKLVKNEESFPVNCKVLQILHNGVIVVPDSEAGFLVQLSESAREIEIKKEHLPKDYPVMVGDWLLINFSGTNALRTIQVLKVEFTEKFNIVGTITRFQGQYCIDGTIFFTDDVIVGGRQPNLGDRVRVIAIASHQDSSLLKRPCKNHYIFKKRALRITYEPEVIPQQMRNTAEEEQVVSEKGSDCEQDNPLKKLFQHKKRVRIQPNSNIFFGDQIFGTNSSRVVTVENFGDRPVLLFKTTIGGIQDVAQFDFDFGNKSNNPQELFLELQPHSSWKFEIKCTTRQFGWTKELLIVDFGSFQIGRWLCVHSVPAKQEKIIYPSRVLTKNWKKTREESISNFSKVKNMNIFASAGLWKNLLLAFDKIGSFEIPDEIIQSFTTRNQSQLCELYPNLLDELDASNYVDQFNVALWFEEIENNIMLRSYDIKDVILKPDTNGRHIVPVKRFIEFHSPPMIGDFVGVYKTTGSKEMYKGPIEEISFNDGVKFVHIRLHAVFTKNYDGGPRIVCFDSGRTAYRKSHFAVKEAMKHLGRDWLFPDSLILTEPRIDYIEDLDDNLHSRVPSNGQANTGKENTAGRVSNQADQRVESLKHSPGNVCSLKWYNPKLNNEQKDAVRQILKGRGRPLPYILFGPPGTGKTVTVVEAIMQFYFLEPSARILVTASSNAATDLIMEHLVATNRFTPEDLIRLNGFNRSQKPLPESIKKFCESSDSLEFIAYSRLIICTVATAGQFFQMDLSADHFTHLFIDEAGYCTEPEAMIPCVLAAVGKQSQVILAGDSQQLGPVLMCNAAFNKILHRSFLERLMTRKMYSREEKTFSETKYNPAVITKLIRSYRSHPILLKLPSQLFYSGELVSRVTTEDQELCKNLPFLLKKGIPLVFHGVDGNCHPHVDSPGWFNLEEAYQVIEYVKLLTKSGVTCEDIGIITPYRRQVEKIRNGLKTSLGKSPLPKIASIEEFQGGERKVVIISTVRSYSEDIIAQKVSNLDFLYSKRRFNVAITRAKALMIVVGNPVVLFRSNYWRSLLEYAIDLEVYTGCQLPKFIGPRWDQVRNSIVTSQSQETEERSDSEDDEEYGEDFEDSTSRF